MIDPNIPTPRVDALARSQNSRIAASSNDPADLMRDALEEMETRARQLERELFVCREALATVTGDLAESLANDMDHRNKVHNKWYGAVKKTRATLAATKGDS